MLYPEYPIDGGHISVRAGVQNSCAILVKKVEFRFVDFLLVLLFQLLHDCIVMSLASLHQIVNEKKSDTAQNEDEI